ncbi:class I SAM-dependent methyltransferase [Litorilituus lipolyticus]|uniref:Methyltransferase domain-containing protein n=1 Tax=Litorilituus lipolyticus TaxID=2491017 RepID=A0A502KKP1_9GAMM|nr:class I SAM-dependent methyltransferase [Litorilituus lipolyticus]TPH12160.1 methyltransferase domain-containing protein [Litorilituus lipolyticus]
MLSYISASDLSQCQRLFHGRGHAYPELSHINIDWFAPVILVTLYQEVEPTWLSDLAEQLKTEITECNSVQVQYRCRKFAPTEVLLGEDIEHTVVNELGQDYNIHFGKAQNSGLFLDMRNGRAWVKENAHGKNILNLFSYTCPFSVVAIAGGAEKVVNIDVSKSSLSKGRENHRLNQHPLERVKFEGVDIFKSNSRIKKHGPYDIIISDPPTLQFGSVNIVKDYAKIIRKIPQWLKPGGQIMLCLNSPDLTEDFLLEQVAQHCPECQFEQQIKPPEVFKEAHQGKGLKVLIFTYLPE